MPLDFTGYVPGIPNMGPKYVPPTTIQLIEALQVEIKAIKRVLETLAPESEVAALTETVNALDGQLDTLTTVTIPAIQSDLSDKENVANKVAEIVTPVTDPALYPSVAAVASFIHDVDDAIREDMDAADGELRDDIDELQDKADGINGAGLVYRTARKACSIPYGSVSAEFSTATSMVALVSGIAMNGTLAHGDCCLIRNGAVTSASGWTLNVNGTGAKPVYSSMAAATAVTTAFNINYTMLFVYDENRVAGGCWVMYYGIDNNTNTIGYQVRTNSYSMPMTSVVYRYRLLFTSKDGAHFVPANNSTSTNATASRTVCQDPIDPHGPIVYYGTTASVNQGSRPAAANLWQQYLVTLGYSFNRTGAALTLTEWTPVYVKAAPQSDGSAIIDSTEPFVQALPTTNDGFIYIFLGVAISATQIELNIEHPVYYHDGTAIRIWTGPVTP